jgi:protoporphyrin/coproporphyrin ferrochelatase
MLTKKTGLLLINLGTPESPEPKDVGNYLREFLMDPLVIDIPFLVRWVLVKCLIVPRRSYQSSRLYKKIWTEQGSPLLVYTQSLSRKVQSALGESFVVLPAMRYGKPSIAESLKTLLEAGVDRLIALPLYPQYSLAASESSIVEFNRQADLILPGVPRQTVPAFYGHEAYLNAVAEVSRPHLEGAEKILFSFHGIPERHVKKTDLTGKHCLSSPNCCDAIGEANKNCYRAQSYATARSLALKLGLRDNDWEVGFQSRLSGTPWIRPYSDAFYVELPEKGTKKLTVLTPSFVADCLETLEEVQIRGDESFREAGGEKLTLVPSLNDHDAWTKAIVKIAMGHQPKT